MIVDKAQYYNRLQQRQLSNFHSIDGEAKRKIGVEHEFCLLQLENNLPVRNPEATKRCLLILKEELGLEVILDGRSKEPIGLRSAGADYPEIVISPDFSCSTLELAYKSEWNLAQSKERSHYYYNRVKKILRKIGFDIIPIGIHPYASKDYGNIYKYNSRYINSPLASEELICQSFQLTIDISKEELAAGIEVLNKLSPLLTCILANSERFDQPNLHPACRQRLFQEYAHKSSAYGFLEGIENYKDYFNLLLELPLSRIKEGHSYQHFKQAPILREFIEASDWPPIPYSSELIYTLESTLWSHVRVRSDIGCLEFRPLDSIPLDLGHSVSALIRGLFADLDKSRGILDVIPNKELATIYNEVLSRGFLAIEDTVYKAFLELLDIASLALINLDQTDAIQDIQLLKDLWLAKENMEEKMMNSFAE